MTTTLAPGTYFTFRYKGEMDYVRVEEGGNSYTLIPESEIPVGTTIHRCVWKKGNSSMDWRLESRGTKVR